MSKKINEERFTNMPIEEAAKYLSGMSIDQLIGETPFEIICSYGTVEDRNKLIKIFNEKAQLSEIDISADDITKKVQAMIEKRENSKTKKDSDKTNDKKKNDSPSGNGRRKKELTIEDLKKELDKMGITVRWNMIAHDVEVKGAEKLVEAQELLSSVLPTIFADMLQKNYSFCNKDRIADDLLVISAQNKYNPVKEMLDNTPEWDGHDYIADLCDAILMDPENKLERTLIKKSLIQAIALAIYNNDPDKPFGAEGVLTLQGAQGAGKTRLLSYLAMNDTRLYREGLCINTRDKDTIIRAVGCWLAELGEVETTFRSDVEALKAFLTQATDRFRVPYGRKDTVQIRHTSFIATCNSDQYLIDTTGNRRFWTVQVRDRINFDDVEKIDFAQLWKQVDHIIAEEGVQSFRLTPSERAQLDTVNQGHVKPVPTLDEVADILAEVEKNPDRYIVREVTVTEFANSHYALKKYKTNQISKALACLGLKTNMYRRDSDGKTGRYLKLPMPVCDAVYNP